MRYLVVAGLLLQASIATAVAADLPVKAPPLPPSLSWTGFYGGFNAGYSFGRHPYTDVQGTSSSLTAPLGGVFGPQIGYNWQVGKVVFGLEADGQWTGQKDMNCGAPICSFNEVPENSVRQVTDRLKWFSTARGRLGWANEQYLLYVTGGAAWAGLDQTHTAGADFITASQTHSATLFGFALGVGAEVAVSNNVSVKVEYLHLDLGSVSNTSVLSGGVPGGIAFDVTQRTTSQIRDNIIRVGVNYHPWGKLAAPVLRGPAYGAWSGFYAGVNGGYAVGRNRFTQFGNNGNGTFFASNDPATVGPHGAFGGAQAGYNWQHNNLVFGIEADAQASAQRDTRCGQVCGFGSATPVSQNVPWFATARGRLGWAQQSYLLYVTGGAAWGSVEESVQFIGFGNDGTRSFKNTRSGWTGGFGAEVRLGGRWTGKIEYLHMDLGTTRNTFAAGTAFLPNQTFTTTSAIRNDLVRVGVNYQLFGP